MVAIRTADAGDGADDEGWHPWTRHEPHANQDPRWGRPVFRRRQVQNAEPSSITTPNAPKISPTMRVPFGDTVALRHDVTPGLFRYVCTTISAKNG